MAAIDLNSDLGEGYGMWSMGDDAAMLDIVTSANVACGFHAGDSDIMLSISKLAKQKGVSIGAHPGYRDLHGFGRRPVAGLTASEIETMVAYQIGALQGIATMAGHRVTFVKVHGALSNVACVDPMTARALASAIKAVDRDLIWVVLPRTEIERAGEAANLPLARELFADRAYEDDAQLMNRSKPGSVLHDAAAIAERVLRMVSDQAVVSASGKVLKMPVDTICVHGDTPGAVAIARQVRAKLEQNGHRLAPFDKALKA
jgi:5-oxoprolinase (ATP-hydrolysing) subunit A